MASKSRGGASLPRSAPVPPPVVAAAGAGSPGSPLQSPSAPRAPEPAPTAAARVFLKKAATVGGAGTAVTYKSDERAFHSRDVPRRAREAVVEVRRGLFDARRTDAWQASVSIPRVFDRTAMSHFAWDGTAYAYNFRAETLPVAPRVSRDAFGRITALAGPGASHRTTEMPVHPGLADKTGWNAATTLTRGEKAADFDRLAATAKRATAAATTTLLADKGHKTPYERQVEYMEELRHTRAILASNRASAAITADDASKRYGGASPPASPLAAAAAATLRPGGSGGAAGITSSLAAAIEAIDVPIKLGRPQRGGDMSRAVRRYRHEGNFCTLPSGESAWSCCGAYLADARGCVATVIDPDRPCYASLR